MTHHEPIKQDVANDSLDELFFKLRDIEYVNGDGHWRIEQQFTLSHVLIAVTNGRGRLTLGSDEFRLRPDAVYVCAAGEIFGAEADNPEGLRMFLCRFDVFRVTGQRNEDQREGLGESMFPLKFPLKGKSRFILPDNSHACVIQSTDIGKAKMSWNVSAARSRFWNCSIV